MRPRTEFSPNERVNMAIFAPTRFRLNSLCADLSLALNRRILIDELINVMIDNYRATAPELQTLEKSADTKISISVAPREADGPSSRVVPVALEAGVLI